MVSESTNYDVTDISKSEVRIILLYSTQAEAKLILANGAKVIKIMDWTEFKISLLPTKVANYSHCEKWDMSTSLKVSKC